MYNGPQTENWYVAPGRFVAKSVAGLGGGVEIFYFWNFDNDMVYTYGFAGIGAVKTSLKFLGLLGSYDWNDIGDWVSVSPAKAFSPEELDGAQGRISKLGLSVMGIGGISCHISAFRGASAYFSSTKVDIKNTGFFKLPAQVTLGGWESLDANKQRGNKTQDWQKFVDGS